MNNTEHEPLVVANFRDIAYQLADDEELFMSRNTVRRVKQGVASDPQPVHYEDIDAKPIEKQPVERVLVTEEFRGVAEWAYSDEDRIRKGLAYPKIRVINNKTRAKITFPVDVAELIVHEYMPIYSTPAQKSDEGAVLSTDFTELIRGLIEEVGVNPDQALLLTVDGARSLQDVDLNSEVHLTQAFDASTDEEAVISVHPRGEAALNLLQMSVARTFATSKHARLNRSSGDDEVVLHVETRPDLQTILLSLIDVVEWRGELLRCHKETNAFGEKEFVVSLIKGEAQLVEELSRETSLNIAMYRAYRTAWEKFPRLEN